MSLETLLIIFLNPSQEVAADISIGKKNISLDISQLSGLKKRKRDSRELGMSSTDRTLSDFTEDFLVLPKAADVIAYPVQSSTHSNKQQKMNKKMNKKKSMNKLLKNDHKPSSFKR